MALNFPSSPTNGQLYTDPNAVIWRFDGVKWNVERGTAYKAFSGAKVSLGTNYSLTATSTAVSFDTVSINIDEYYSVGTPTRISVSQSAFYRVNFSIYTSTIGASYNLVLKKNSSDILSSVTISPNQSTNFDEIIELVADDYLEVYASEVSGVGELTTLSFFEITRIGYSLGTAVSAATIFSGVRGILTSTYSVISTPTAVSWDDTEFNQNSDASGATYWTVGLPTRFTIGVGGYYRLKGFIGISTAGTYTFTLRKNGGTTLATTIIDAFQTTQIDELYQFDSGDFVELVVNDTNSSGTLSTGTYLELIRIGV